MKKNNKTKQNLFPGQPTKHPLWKCLLSSINDQSFRELPIIAPCNRKVLDWAEQESPVKIIDRWRRLSDHQHSYIIDLRFCKQYIRANPGILSHFKDNPRNTY
jgi:hypothetical protein